MADSHDTFDAGWLALREPVDHRSRSTALVDLASEFGRAHGWTRGLDLGCGSGSNLRFLVPRLEGVTRWVALDHDPELLQRVAIPDSAGLETVVGDLAREGLIETRRCDLVTVSALLDLVTESWMDELARICAEGSRGALFALTYDGTVTWDDADPVSEAVRVAVNRHQTGQKGMGRALGPAAARVAAERFQAVGMTVRTESTPWRLSGPADAPLARSLVDGWTEAAVEMDPARRDAFLEWRVGRMGHLDRDGWTLTVGHVDLLALPGA